MQMLYERRACLNDCPRLQRRRAKAVASSFHLPAATHAAPSPDVVPAIDTDDRADLPAAGARALGRPPVNLPYGPVSIAGTTSGEGAACVAAGRRNELATALARRRCKRGQSFRQARLS